MGSNIACYQHHPATGSVHSSLSHLSDGSISLAVGLIKNLRQERRFPGQNWKEGLTTAFHVDLRPEPKPSLSCQCFWIWSVPTGTGEPAPSLAMAPWPYDRRSTAPARGLIIYHPKSAHAFVMNCHFETVISYQFTYIYIYAQRLGSAQALQRIYVPFTNKWCCKLPSFLWEK